MDSFQEKLKLNYSQALEAVSYFRCYYAETGIHQNALFTGIADVLHTPQAKRLHPLCGDLKTDILC